jgi:hypothetical protein
MLSNRYYRPIPGIIQWGCAGIASVVLILTAGVPVAEASPTFGQPTLTSPGSCPLQRIGTQFVRCDNLTGAGVSAPPWIPELASAKATHKLDPC